MSDYWEKCSSNDGLVARTVKGELDFHQWERCRLPVLDRTTSISMMQDTRLVLPVLDRSTDISFCKVDGVGLSAIRGVKHTGGVSTGGKTLKAGTTAPLLDR